MSSAISISSNCEWPRILTAVFTAVTWARYLLQIVDSKYKHVTSCVQRQCARQRAHTSESASRRAHRTYNTRAFIINVIPRYPGVQPCISGSKIMLSARKTNSNNNNKNRRTHTAAAAAVTIILGRAGSREHSHYVQQTSQMSKP